MDFESLEIFTKLHESIVKDDWKKALDSLFVTLRKNFVFDNLAIYFAASDRDVPEVVYARAAGRGRNKEAEASWGEEIANQVINTKKVVVTIPKTSQSTDRIIMPHMLGLPLGLLNGSGALVLVRFGGPEYTTDQMPLAALAATQTTLIFEHRTLKDSLAQLEIARHRAQFQDDFIATISHELHTPLGFIKGYTTSLLRSDTVWDSATQREFLTIIDEESDHLVVMIDHMLDSARLQSGSMPMDFQPVRLDSLLRDVVMRVQSRQKDLEIDLELESAPAIEADTVRMSQVFDNFIDNAIKYAPGSKILLSLHCKPDEQVVAFTDFGPGISSEHLPFLFERFYRVPGHPGTRGTGLGLFICKQIIQAHHGRITVKTSLGKGTTFHIELPTRQRSKGKEDL